MLKLLPGCRERSVSGRMNFKAQVDKTLEFTRGRALQMYVPCVGCFGSIVFEYIIYTYIYLSEFLEMKQV